MAPATRKQKKGPPTKQKEKSHSNRKGKKILQWNLKQMEAAMQDVRNGMSIQRAAINNDVPRITLYDKVSTYLMSSVSNVKSPKSVTSSNLSVIIVADTPKVSTYQKNWP